METTGKDDFDLNDEGNIEYYLNGSVDPFKYITIASICMAVFKSKFLKQDSSSVSSPRRMGRG